MELFSVFTSMEEAVLPQRIWSQLLSSEHMILDMYHGVREKRFSLATFKRIFGTSGTSLHASQRF
jgi:hypothetical protein